MFTGRIQLCLGIVTGMVMLFDKKAIRVLLKNVPGNNALAQSLVPKYLLKISETGQSTSY